MKSKQLIIWTLLVLLTLVTWGCGSSRDSSGTVVGDGSTLASAEAVGISNCLTCHSPASTLVQEWMRSRHGNHMLSTTKLANDTETPGNDPSPGSCAYECHDPFNDRDDIDYGYVATFEDPALTNWGTASPASFIGCEGCHGGGQFHNGIKSGIPFAAPSTEQCAQCHYLNDALGKPEWVAEGFYPHHTTSSGGNNVRRNIFDSHVDDPATPDAIEGYVVKTTGTGGCKDCHIAHDFNLTINYQWANSAHGGHIKEVKDTVLAAGAVDAATLLANVTAAAVTTTGDAWRHYDWDAANRNSCQRCHTSTGLMNFMADTANYDYTANDFSHLEGWTPTVSSGQNEMLYCWGCHSDTQNGVLREDPNGTTLDFLYEDETGASGPATFVVLPDKGNSNVCGACHAGRGNDTSIRSSYADAATAAAADGVGGELGALSSRFSGHHAPTAGSLYAAVTHTGFEFEDPAGPVGTPLDYSTPLHEHDEILQTTSGPCAGCHMAGTADHHFEAVDRTGATAIVNQTLCDSCHGGAMDGAALDTLQADFITARDYLTNLVKNVNTNYLNAGAGLDISATANRNAETLALNDFGAFQNSLYMVDEPCIYVHNSLYGKRLVFDSIDWLEDGSLDGTITPNLTWLGGTTRP